jgi:site-specific DNA recombinase
MADRAITYARVSTDAQGDEGSSLETQRERCLGYCREHGYQHVEHYQDTWTGSRYRDRPGLSALREAVRARLCDVVVVYAIDRLSRNQAHLYVLAEELADHGVRLEFVTESFEDSAVGRFIRSAKAFAAEVEREKIAERTVRGKQARLRSGRLLISNTPLYGYLPNATRDAYVLNPETAPVVERIYHLCLEGYTTRGIARLLASEGVPSPSGRPGWSNQQVGNILHHPAYSGRHYGWYSQRTPWSFEQAIPLPEGVAPRIVSDAVWEAVQARLPRNKAHASRNARDPFAALLLGGLARCGTCGWTMSYEGRSGDGRYPKYVCSRRNYLPAPCPDRPVISVRRLDADVWASVMDLVLHPERLIAHWSNGHDAAGIEREAARLGQRERELTRQQRNLTRALADTDEPAVASIIRADLVDVTRQLEAVRAAMQALTAQQQAAALASADGRALVAWANETACTIANAEAPERRRIVERLGVSVLVYRHGHRPRWEVVWTARQWG